MKTMSDYILFCTPEQTKKALELGAPIDRIPIGGRDASRPSYFTKSPDEEGYQECPAYYIPTAEQMIGWLESQRMDMRIANDGSGYDWSISVRKTDSRHCIYIKESDCFYNSRKEATIAAIDAALEYLTNNKK